MLKNIKKSLTLAIALLMSVGLFAGCGKKAQDDGKPTDKAQATATAAAKGDPTEIRFGTFSRKTLDPTYKDPVTGKSLMQPDRYAATQKAIKAVKDKYNVDIKYVQYSGPAEELLLKSVLSNDPIAEIVGIPGYVRGNIIAQNILQPLDEYADKFKDLEYTWMMPGKIYGHNYLLNYDMEFTRTECLMYNISYLQKVESLKENGKVVLPVELWKQGKWTWKTFEDYLTKVSTYYANKKAPVRTDMLISTYATDIKAPVLNAIKSTGESLYGDNGMGVDSPNTIKAIEFIDRLYSKKLITTMTSYGATQRSNAMRDGEVVFTDLANWVMAPAGEGLASRGESMGIVPFPRPDDLEKDDPNYQQLVNAPGSYGMLKGFPKERVDLAIDVYRLYCDETLKGRSGSESVVSMFKSKEIGKSEAFLHGLDAGNEEYGNDIVDAYMSFNPKLKPNEMYTLCDWSGKWDTLLRDSITGNNGSPKYAVAIAAQKATFQSSIDDITAIVGSDKIVDNIPPAISMVGTNIALAKGTDASKIDWAQYIKAVDSIDGDIDIKDVKVDTSKIKFDTAGWYDKSLIVTAKDKAGNERVAQLGVAIYDPENKTAPTLVPKETYRNIKKDEDALAVKWGNDFVEKAESAEGFDLKALVTADVSSLDVTKAGKYDVTLTVTDYAGNKTEQKISVTVADK